MRSFLNILFLAFIIQIFPSCSGCGEQTEVSEKTEVMPDETNSSLAGAEDRQSFGMPSASEIEAQKDTNVIARAKAEALKKGKDENSVNSNFKSIAPKSVTDKLVNEATSTAAKTEGQEFERVEGKKFQKIKKNHPIPENSDKVNTGFAANVVKTKDGKIVPQNSNAPTDAGGSSASKSAERPLLYNIHSTWDRLLKENVSSTGVVNYQGLKKREAQLEEYLTTLNQNPPKSDWSKSQTMAYWINAYNAFTVKLILDNMPLNSIQKLDGGKVWDRKWIKIGTKTYSLNNIENDILRPKYKDARIHFAVNCAAKSCPPLWNQAWTGDNLNSALDRRTRMFINNTTYNQIFETKASVSKIFEWYAGDFGNLIDYLNKYSNKTISKDVKLSYTAYDWGLNGK